MGKYRKIDTRIWNDAKFHSLSKDAKWAFFYVLTHPNMTSLGAMRATVQGLAAELGSLPKAFLEASKKGLLEIDEDASYVGAVNFLKYNGPESPNVVKSWAHSIDLVPECELKAQLIKRVVSHVGGLHKGFAEALPKAFRLPLPIPEQEQEQEQEKQTGVLDGEETNGRMDPDEFFARWKKFASSKGLKVERGLTAGRKKHIKIRLAEDGWIDLFTESIQKLPIPNNPPKWTWQPDLDWLIANGSNVVVLAEGKYDDRAGQSTSGPAQSDGEYADG